MGVGLPVAAAALRPDGGLRGTATTGLIGPIGLVVLLALGWAALVGRFAVRFREEVRHLDGPTPWAERLRGAAMVLLPGAAVAVPLLLFAFRRLHGPVGTVNGPLEVLPSSSHPPTPPPVPVDPSSGGLLKALVAVLIGALAVAVAVAFVVFLVQVWRRLSISRNRLPAPLPAAPARPEEVLAAAVATGRRALSGDDARAAVIACYAAMEGSLAASGTARRACDSPTELLERAVADDHVDRGSAEALTGLFREARYSSHPMGDGHVGRAQGALDAIAAHLAARAEAPSEPVPAAGTTAGTAAGTTGPAGGRG
ncbi:DUF4129 domain-containing protein [Streptomyces sp. CB01881]|uniref:DUF4129 domain-containing protein n=1 Tax=Streptomyces sp. CB01881 TaxID=2078691 RepID=UPI0011DFCD8F|nr:DUF4129 domain-containing protein [Streptomyces sp. CB01881]TYC76303.1 DUF4129 domain-containing protein [Streptomyces sp. CB01881]